MAIRVRTNWKYLSGISLISLVTLSACGGSGARPSPAPTPPPITNPAPTPTPPGPAPAPTPTPAPTPAPTPTPTPTPPSGPTPTPGPYDTAEFRGSDGPQQHGALTAYNAGATGAGIILGVIDSGIDTTSGEFTGRIHADSGDFAGNRGIVDEAGHGSAVASVGAGSKNGNSTHGIAFDTDILVLRTDTPGSCTTDDPDDPDDDGCSHAGTAIAAAINQATTSGARVINISLGGPDLGSATRNAIRNATAAGIIVVVSAGNDGEAAPDGFAAGIADNGNGLVIIAGSVGSAGDISSFSNQAGAQASSYLTALGERVRADDHEGTAFLWTGTSFSAPQISGAAALLAQAFPNLTGAQIVELLLTSATDAGATGTDTTFGRGILNIANAFQPQGQSSLAGTAVAVNPFAGGGQVSTAMGDAAVQGQNVSAVILDGYGRAFSLNLAHDLKSAPQQFALTSALSGSRRNMAASNSGVSIAVNIAQTPVGLVERTNLRLSQGHAKKSKMLAASVMTKLSSETTIALGFNQSAGGLVAKVQGSRSAAFLIAHAPTRKRGFSAQAKSAVALRKEIAGFGLSISAENGAVLNGTNSMIYRDSLTGNIQNQYQFSGLGLALDKTIGTASLSLAGNWLSEEDTILGSRFSDAIGASGAKSWFVDGRASYEFGNGWKGAASWRQGWTKIDSASFLTGGLLRSNGFAADISKLGLFGRADQIAFRFAQPLRISSGGLNLNLPVGYQYETQLTEFGQRTLNLAPRGREIVGELAYSTPFFGGYLNGNLFWRQEPGHFENRADDLGAAVRYQLKF